MDPLARLHLRAHAQQTREDNARALEQQYNRQAEYAARYVDRYPQATTNAYLTRKGVAAAPGIRINDKQELVIPFSNAHGDIRSYQRIPLTGGKDARILKDSEKQVTGLHWGRHRMACLCCLLKDMPQQPLCMRHQVCRY